MIELKHLSGGGGSYAPVRNLQCRLNNGGVIGVLGEKGAGQSTLLALLAGALLPSAGTLKINGFDPVRERARVSSLVGYLPRGYEPDGTMTPMEYLLFAADMHGAVYERALRRAQGLLETLGLLAKRDTLIANLSFGERRLLAVAGTLMAAPEFILLDSPFAGLAPRAAQILREWIPQMGENATVLVSTTAPHELDRICTRAIILKNGGTLAGVCETHEQSLSAVCAAVLSKELPTEESEPEQSPPKRKNRWRLLTASTAEVELIDPAEKEDATR